MIRVTCDTCSRPIDRDSDAWIGVDVTDAPEPLHPDPVQAMDDAEMGMVSSLTEIKVLGSDHEFHFCSPSCLSTWALDWSVG